MKVTIPRFGDGRELELGDRVKIEDGTILKAASIVLTESGALVSPVELQADGRRLFSVGESGTVGSPDDDTPEDLDRDASLAPSDYLKKRGIDAEGLSAGDRIHAMVDDIRRRERRLLGA